MKPRLGIWLLSQGTVKGYDTFRSLVVVSETLESAVKIHPAGAHYNESDNTWSGSSSWPRSPDKVQGDLIGRAAPHLKEGEIICKDFHGG